jgi:23S rRNA G2445 N2-methylase RlmL
MILLSRWKPDRVFIDPFCGSGTIPIEAAMIGRNIAPGLHRDFASQHWPDLNKHFWINARQEAADLADHDQPWAFSVLTLISLLLNWQGIMPPRLVLKTCFLFSVKILPS